MGRSESSLHKYGSEHHTYGGKSAIRRVNRIRNPHLPVSQRGFGLVEAMITIGISLILLTIAAPDLGALVRKNRVKTAAEDFASAIVLARTEAIKRGAPVIMCRTGNPAVASASLSCRANTPDGTANAVRDWSPGWIMYAKPGTVGGGGADYDYSADGEPILVGDPAPGGVAIKSDFDGNQWLAFFGDGTLNESGTTQYAICDSRGASEGRLVTIPLIGRPHVTKSPGSCSPS